MLKINTETILMKFFMKNASIETKWAFGGSSPPTSTWGNWLHGGSIPPAPTIMPS